MASLVSILIPCYNAEKWIAETLKSAAAQTWSNVEIILVDDGSRDRSFVIAQSFSGPNIKVLRQENSGASAARNRAYAECQGEWIQHLDADDLLSPDKIASQMECVSPYGDRMMAICGTMHFADGTDPRCGILHDGWPAVDADNPIEWLIDLYGPESGSMVQPGAWLTPRRITEVIGPWDEAVNPNPDDDGEYFCRAVLSSQGIRRSQSGLTYYRKFANGLSLSGRKSRTALTGRFRSLDLTSQWLLARNQSGRARQALARRFKEFAFDAYPQAPDLSASARARAKELGFGDFSPQMPTTVGRMVAATFGWKLAKRVSLWKASLKQAVR